ncbi:MAG TPA: hypothetical protein VI455_10665 [Terriglobia bacterium]
MAGMTITDNLSLSVNFPPDGSSAFLKYLLSPGPINLVLTQPQKVGAILDQLVPCGLTFTTPVKLGVTAEELAIQPGLQGFIGINTGTLFDPKTDDFGVAVAIPPGQAYVSAGIKASLNAGLTNQSGDLQFGFGAGTGVTLTNYRLFDANTKVISAVQTLFQQFVIPADLQDVENMTPNTVATVEGSGSLKFSANANLAAVTNPLATLDLLSVATLSIKPGASLALGVGVTLTGGYQVRVRRLDGRKFQLGYETKRGEQLAVTASAGSGLTAGVGGFDLLASLLKAISADPAVDKDTFGQQTGLSDGEITAISAAVKAGIDRSLSLSLSSEINLSAGSAAAFSYEIDLDALDDDGKQAVHAALGGDLEGLEGSDHPGVTRLTSVFSSLRDGRHVLKINLLGIFNFGSVTELLKNGRLIVDRETGSITVADQATARRIGFTSDNFAQDGSKLRTVLASGVTMTAGYTVGGVIPNDPSFGCSCWSFEFHQKTNQQNIQFYLHVAQALQLMSAADASAKLTSVGLVPNDGFGPSTLHADSSYAGAAFEGMFLQGDGDPKQPRSRPDYENVGRAALASLLPPDDPVSPIRRVPLTDDALWQKLTNLLSAEAMKQELTDLGITDNPAALGAVVDDVLLIFWWAGAMSAMANALGNLSQFLKGNPKPDPQNNTFKKLRQALADAMVSVSNDAKPSFGEPWGLLVMAQASGLNDATTVTAVSPKLSFVVHRP